MLAALGTAGAFVPKGVLVFCCLGALAIAGQIESVDKDLLGWWLCERQLKSGGLNGRPQKLEDVGGRHVRAWQAALIACLG